MEAIRARKESGESESEREKRERRERRDRTDRREDRERYACVRVCVCAWCLVCAVFVWVGVWVGGIERERAIEWGRNAKGGREKERELAKERRR